MRSFIVVSLILIVAALGYMISENRKNAQLSDARARIETDSMQRLRALEATRKATVAVAIIDHRVEIGMTKDEVLSSWGRNDSSQPAPTELRQFGIFESWWFFNRGREVYFDLDGRVVRIRDAYPNKASLSGSSGQ